MSVWSHVSSSLRKRARRTPMPAMPTMSAMPAMLAIMAKGLSPDQADALLPSRNQLITKASVAAGPFPLMVASGSSPLWVTALQVLPPLACQAVFIAPMDAMRQIKKEGRTGQLPLVPYVSMVLSCSLWVCYGHSVGDMTVLVPNVPGFFFGSYYCYTYLNHAPAAFNKTPYIASGFAGALGITGVMMMMEPAAAATVLGLAGNAAVVAMFGGPLLAIKNVIDTKSTRSLPLAMSIASFTNCSLWTSYGLLVAHDPFIWCCNGLGLASSLVQLGLFAKYGVYRPSSSSAPASNQDGAASGGTHK